MAIALGSFLAPTMVSFAEMSVKRLKQLVEGFTALGDIIKGLGTIAIESFNIVLGQMDLLIAGFLQKLIELQVGVLSFLNKIPGISIDVDTKIEEAIEGLKRLDEVRAKGTERFQRAEEFFNFDNMLDANQQELDILAQHEANKLEVKKEARDEADEEGFTDLFGESDEDFEADLQRFADRLNSIEDIEFESINRRLEGAKNNTEKRKILEDEIVKAKTTRFRAEKRLDDAIAQSAFDSLSIIVGDNAAARVALLLASKAFAVANILVNSQTAASLALATIPPPAGEIIAAERLAAGRASAAIVAVTAIPEVIASFAHGAFNIPSDMQANIHRGEMILPAPLADTVRSAILGGGAGGNQEVKVRLELSDEASRFITIGQREDTTLGIQR